jgi:hypothetical protein
MGTHGGELGRASSNELSGGLALELGDEGVQALVVGLNADSGEDLLDIGSGGVGVATDLEEEVCSDVTHLEGEESTSDPPLQTGQSLAYFEVCVVLKVKNR